MKLFTYKDNGDRYVIMTYAGQAFVYKNKYQIRILNRIPKSIEDAKLLISIEPENKEKMWEYLMKYQIPVKLP